MASLDYLVDLNPEQHRAVTHSAGPLLIFAGAGSGKTRVLTRRVAHLILEHNHRLDEVLAVTFTNKAATEMKHRMHGLLGKFTGRMWVSTFHAMCCRILRAHADLLEYTEKFAIYDTDDSRSVMKRVYDQLNVDPRMIDPRMVLNRIDRAKNAYQTPDHVRDDRMLPRELAHTIADLFEGYQKELQRCNAMDFGDLICNVVTLFKLEPSVLEAYRQQFRSILIDEYQDTNRVQYLLVQQLAQGSRNICVVGDDDQSIYAFRGATIENILNFKRDFPEAEVITLDTNYRSTKNILAAANSVITRNRRRQEKKMKTPNDQGRPIVSLTAFDEREEAEMVVREIVSLIDKGIPRHSMAIFYRTNAQSRALEEMLNANRIPYQIFGSVKFYERKEVKDILAYLRLILNPNDNEAFLRIINVPVRGIGNTTVGHVVSYADKERLSLFPALQRALEQEASFLTKKAKSSCATFVDLIIGLRTRAEETARLLGHPDPALFSDRVASVPKLLHDIAEQSGYIAQLKAQATPEAESRLENIFELFEVAGETFQAPLAEGVPVRIHDFLEHASLATDLDTETTLDAQGNPVSDSISLMTLHLAKGLEFDVVFVTGLEEGVLPHMRSLEDREGLEEERRLCYVGITRARKLLYLSRAEHRQMFSRGGFFSGEASRFLDDIPPEILDERRLSLV